MGLFVEYTFGRTLIFSKMRSASQTSAISRKYGIAPNQFFRVLQYCPPLFFQSSIFRLAGQPIQICYIIQKKMRKKMPIFFIAKFRTLEHIFLLQNFQKHQKSITLLGACRNLILGVFGIFLAKYLFQSSKFSKGIFFT